MPADVTPVELRVEGANKIDLIAAHLKRTGGTDLRRELLDGLRRASAPLKQTAQTSGPRVLPSRGGLDEFVSSARFGVSTKTGRNPSVSITAKKTGHDLRAIDRGRLRHPVFGNRRVWVTQTIRPGWFTKTLEGEVSTVRRELIDVLDDMARKVTGGMG